MFQASERDEEIQLIRRCLEEESGASAEFQVRFGELIYGYPMRVYRTPSDEAGDFYVFAFDAGRLYRRLRTFEGRAPLRAYLLGFVLDDLFLEWKRAEHSIDTVSIDDVPEPPAADPMDGGTNVNDETALELNLDALLAAVDVNKAVVFKLLHAEDCELNDAEIRHIAAVANKPVAVVLDEVEGLRARIREREQAARADQDNLDSVQAWIELYERRCAAIDLALESLPPTGRKAERLRDEKAELVRKAAKRRRQREKVAERARRRKTTAPYKEIAAVLETSVGNVGSQIARLRDELAQIDTAPQRNAGNPLEEHHGADI